MRVCVCLHLRQSNGSCNPALAPCTQLNPPSPPLQRHLAAWSALLRKHGFRQVARPAGAQAGTYPFAAGEGAAKASAEVEAAARAAVRRWKEMPATKAGLPGLRAKMEQMKLADSHSIEQESGYAAMMVGPYGTAMMMGPYGQLAPRISGVVDLAHPATGAKVQLVVVPDPQVRERGCCPLLQRCFQLRRAGGAGVDAGPGTAGSAGTGIALTGAGPAACSLLPAGCFDLPLSCQPACFNAASCLLPRPPLPGRARALRPVGGRHLLRRHPPGHPVPGAHLQASKRKPAATL